ncbi:hypothetical protein CDL15_Pgr002089 [Punica granatum]|uniref:Subtilisin-like protease SBT4.15 n=1 Tax=Punica granatum TaxID=22663 RepID=A0A218XC62_PUNGR|nr:hypothetical protein CDL15_Pgr002089 [Punica granatum]
MSWNVFLFSFSLFLAATMVRGSPDEPARKSYIVYMGDVPEASINAADEHQSLLVNAIGDAHVARSSIIHSYRKSFNGFAARLLPHEVHRLMEDERVISVFPNKRRQLHTTKSWDFLGMPLSLQNKNLKMQNDIIIGILDTGIYARAPSFNDHGYGPAPAKWKGTCAKGFNFSGCNNKVIGAKYFNLDDMAHDMELSPADDDGHGTHTSSIAAGVPVHNASFYGIAEGTARGGVPSARIAMYKVCWGAGCNDIDLLAGFDEAIADGVDLISVSIGGPSKNYFNDPIAIGSFHAMRAGILTTCSAGNGGPDTFTVQNVAPWVLTVGASSIDRQFKAAVRLGNGDRSVGVAINSFSSGKRMFPLTSGILAANSSNAQYGNASACDYGTLSAAKVKGKVVYCLDNVGQDRTIKELGGIGIITSSDFTTDMAMTTVIPGTTVSSTDGMKIDQYISSTNGPQASISRTRSFNATAPSVASFSARGPQLISRNILKPDISAPGLGILAAYSKIPSVTGDPTDPRHSTFNILSGTSMACPHAAAAAAYVKSLHPDWSPAAIRSALMTTATPMKIRDKFEELSSGSGQINPTKAADPGLVYDIGMKNYIRHLCTEGYNDTMIGLLMGGKTKFNCSTLTPAHGVDCINYPSMHMQLKNTDKVYGVFFRTVTNVGSSKSVYEATVTPPEGISVKVIPSTLTFDQPRQKRSFKVLVEGVNKHSRTQILPGSIVWSDSVHVVRSPMLIYIGRYSLGPGLS